MHTFCRKRNIDLHCNSHGVGSEWTLSVSLEWHSDDCYHWLIESFPLVEAIAPSTAYVSRWSRVFVLRGVMMHHPIVPDCFVEFEGEKNSRTPSTKATPCRSVVVVDNRLVVTKRMLGAEEPKAGRVCQQGTGVKTAIEKVFAVSLVARCRTAPVCHLIENITCAEGVVHFESGDRFFDSDDRVGYVLINDGAFRRGTFLASTVGALAIKGPLLAYLRHGGEGYFFHVTGHVQEPAWLRKHVLAEEAFHWGR